ncbi:uncharacterized protein PV09_01296 [Verruconis gallopava]|uniref:Heterokaryon incompatibility domain-containing protein n=1 Tax=Verruconis gallopava TaxID=253628 RepID=A0A0D1Z5Z6_9PEZI|nr:uncharacterized protein PV09_01296 [Verruconis gallopava]KIW08382.1 hypothetical protein PV09_01296 [Verruconis gallopava]
MDKDNGPLGNLPNTRSFRLLQLFTMDMDGNINPPEVIGPLLAYRTKIFSLDDYPQYYALSYTWGSAICEDPDHPDVDNSTVHTEDPLVGPTKQASGEFENVIRGGENGVKMQKATSNLQEAMKQLYCSGMGHKWVWIDAVCIDQKNIEEKMIQVGLMDEIYSKASSVIVWLGPYSEDYDSFAWLHEDFLAAIGTQIQINGQDFIKDQDPLDPKFTEKLGIVPPSGSWRRTWDQFFDFCRARRWFSRAWIVQEVALARNLVLLCGDRFLPWENVETLGHLIQVQRWAPLIGKNVAQTLFRAAGDHTVRLYMMRENLNVQRAQALSALTVEDGNSVTKEAKLIWYRYLQKLLLEGRSYSATDPRDKIFALLGLMKKCLPSKMEIPIRPDYSESSSPVSVFTSVASLLLTELPRLSNLSHIDFKAQGRLDGLPSWVPDYTHTLAPLPFIMVRGEICPFDCCPSDVLPEEKCKINGHSLQVKGAVFDRISSVCPSMWDMLKSVDFTPCFTLVLGLDPTFAAEHGGHGEILWRTMIADSFNFKAPRADMAKNFKDWAAARIASAISPPFFETDSSGKKKPLLKLDENQLRDRLNDLKKLNQLCAGFEFCCVPTEDEVLQKCRLMHHFNLVNFVSAHSNLAQIEDVPSFEAQTKMVEGRSAEFRIALGPTIPFRRLYLTEHGYLGLGPENAVEGDEIWMLQGAMVPFVLRRGEQAQLSLVGETYVHGFMHGKMAREVKDQVSLIELI